MKIGTLTIESPVLYTDQTLQTASWYDRYVLLPGKYDIEHDAVRSHAFSVLFRLDAVLLESYRVNRLFTASSSELTRPLRVVTLNRDMRAYEFATGVAQGEEIWNGQVTLEPGVECLTHESETVTFGRPLVIGDLMIAGKRVA